MKARELKAKANKAAAALAVELNFQANGPAIQERLATQIEEAKAQAVTAEEALSNPADGQMATPTAAELAAAAQAVLTAAEELKVVESTLKDMQVKKSERSKNRARVACGHRLHLLTTEP